MSIRHFSDATNNQKNLKVSTNYYTGFLIDIQMIGTSPRDDSIIQKIAQRAREMIVLRALNREHVLDTPDKIKLLHTILQGVTIVPVNATRTFLQSVDYDLLANFFGTFHFPKYNFFRLEPQEVAFLEAMAFGDTINTVNFEEEKDTPKRNSKEKLCWTRKDSNGNNYTHCIKEVAALNLRPGGPFGPTITFDPVESGQQSIENKFHPTLARIIEQVVRETGFSIQISSSIRGDAKISQYADEDEAKGKTPTVSHHYFGKAIDISFINGLSVKRASTIHICKNLTGGF
ncbi:MAG: hypothetical protein HQL96_17565 [Magnetococcales bacterium]|nr:hypothetical protein [Magnetococcales bacterium]